MSSQLSAAGDGRQLTATARSRLEPLGPAGTGGAPRHLRV